MVSVHPIEHPRTTRRARGTGVATSRWTAWGSVAQVAVTDPAALRSVRRLVERELAAAERAAYRHRPDAEIHRLYRAGGDAVTVSPSLARSVAAALATAERTGGAVDPTVAAAVTRLERVASGRRTALPTCGRRAGAVPGPRPVGAAVVQLHDRRLRVPAGVTLDLGATAPGVACDDAAARVADRLGVGLCVVLGGTIATAGPGPRGGWPVRVGDRATGAVTGMLLPAGAALVATDRTGMVDPDTGEPVTPVWEAVAAIGPSCLEAAGWTAAAHVRGTGAPAWLAQLGVTARLTAVGGGELALGAWNQHLAPDGAHDPAQPALPQPRTRAGRSGRTEPRRTILR